jgi:hypothetical protein
MHNTPPILGVLITTPSSSEKRKRITMQLSCTANDLAKRLLLQPSFAQRDKPEKVFLFKSPRELMLGSRRWNPTRLLFYGGIFC